ncbi:MAG: NUDIX domain-containing protein [Actinobacteria bacterium]|nr:NUDIX domain-containing protein [Actinomycetota bacterium]
MPLPEDGPRGPTLGAAGERRRRAIVDRPEVAVGAVVRDERRRLLVIQRGQPPMAGRWTLPGGRVERGESLAAAVAREVAEETSLEVAVGPLVGIHEVVTETHHLVILDHLAEVTAGTPEARSDAAAVAWMGRAELVDAGPTDGLLDFLDRHGVELAP